MKTASNVLVTCGGKWVGHVLQLKQAMREVPPLADGKLLVADRAELTPAGHFADGAFVVPSIDDPQYIESLLEICEGQGVRVLVPLIDLDVIRLAPHRERFAEAGTSLLCPPEDLAELLFDKWSFEAFGLEAGIRMPRSFSAEELDGAKYPLFFKPRRGFGSIGSGVCESAEEAGKILREKPETMFQEYVQAPEISVDAYICSTGECTGLVQRVRDKVIGGEAYQSHTVKLPEVHREAMQTIESLSRRGLRGPVVMQVLASDPPVVIDVNPRIGSGTVLSNVASNGRLLRSLLAEGCGLKCSGDPDDYAEGICLYRYLGDVIHAGGLALAVMPRKAA